MICVSNFTLVCAFDLAELLAHASASLASAGKSAKESLTSLATAAKNSSAWSSIARLAKHDKSPSSSLFHSNGSGSGLDREDSASVSSSAGTSGGVGAGANEQSGGSGHTAANGIVSHGRSKTTASNQNSTPTKSYYDAIKQFPLSDKAFPLTGEPTPVVNKKGPIGTCFVFIFFFFAFGFVLPNLWIHFARSIDSFCKIFGFVVQNVWISFAKSLDQCGKSLDM